MSTSDTAPGAFISGETGGSVIGREYLETPLLDDYVEVECGGEVFPSEAPNPRLPYAHQKEALTSLDQLNRLPAFKTLAVLPTGAGKTYTASTWLLRNAVDKGKKVLWLAHRQLLLDQAAQSFKNFAYRENMPNASSFRYRVVSGAPYHDRAVNIQPSDNVLIVGKDSIGRNLHRLDEWLSGEQEIFLVVDEAHHSIAKTYRKVIDYVQERVQHVKLPGLTATPFRTAAREEELLAQVYSDDMAYQIGLKELISRRILSKPVFETCSTQEDYGIGLGLDAWKRIQHLDTLPEEIAAQMAESAARNKLIADKFLKDRDKYGQTIVFAVNIVHAIQLASLFKNAGVAADFVVSSIRDAATGVTVGPEINDEKIEKYRNGELQVLVNVNILTEGVDLPQTKTVFLTRPTVSATLMTQMIGRGLRGTKAGGTDEAYIVSFVDDWNERIAWVNPESLLGENSEFEDTAADRIRKDVRLIAISKIEEFGAILNEAVDTTELEAVPFSRRIPIGMYAFSFLESNGVDNTYQVMVYDDSAAAYEEFLAALPALFDSYGVTDENFLSDEVLTVMEQQCRDTFFCGEMVPPYASRDIISILKYYTQYGAAPHLYTFDEIDKDKLDAAVIAKHIWDEDMRQQERAAYVNALWDNADDNLLRLFFGRKAYFFAAARYRADKIDGS